MKLIPTGEFAKRLHADHDSLVMLLQANGCPLPIRDGKIYVDSGVGLAVLRSANLLPEGPPAHRVNPALGFDAEALEDAEDVDDLEDDGQDEDEDEAPVVPTRRRRR